MGVRLIDRKDAVVANLKSQLAMGLNAAVIEFTSAIIRDSPIDTGFLRTHLGITKSASPNDLSAEIRSLAPYSGFTDTGRFGTLWWTRNWLALRERFPRFLYSKGSSTGGGVIKSALMDYFGPMGRKGGGF